MQSVLKTPMVSNSSWNAAPFPIGKHGSVSSPVSSSSPMSLTYDIQWDPVYWQQWHLQNWTICIWFSVMYVIAVRFGVFYMNNRKPLDLRYPLALWSALLAIFSIAGSYSMVPEILWVLSRDGFHAAACDNSFSQDSSVLFWSWLFVWSKVLEFGDTAFIILRKQKLSFLHWYHHAMTVICVFTYFPGMVAINRWTGSMNYLVHSIMYSYYSLRALRFRIPKPVAITITSMQIAQMMIGFYVAIYELAMKLTGSPCKITLGESVFSFSVYFSYFLLFLNFFIRTYFQSTKKTIDSPTQLAQGDMKKIK